MLVSKTMPNTTTETPDWLREMETILEELNEGVVVVDAQLRVIFANEALTRMGHFERNEIHGCTPDAIFPSEDLPISNGNTNRATVTAATAVSSTCPGKTAPKSRRSSAAGLFRVLTSRSTCCLS